jgi:hypothetical protein
MSISTNRTTAKRGTAPDATTAARPVATTAARRVTTRAAGPAATTAARRVTTTAARRVTTAAAGLIAAKAARPAATRAAGPAATKAARLAATKAARAGLLAATALLAAAAPARAAAPADPPGTWLYLTVAQGDERSAPAREGLLLCDPPQGHARATEACAELAAAHGDITRIPAKKDVYCPMIYAPVTVQAHGRWAGRKVDYTQTFSSRCFMNARTGSVFALDG